MLGAEYWQQPRPLNAELEENRDELIFFAFGAFGQMPSTDHIPSQNRRLLHLIFDPTRPPKGLYPLPYRPHHVHRTS